MSADGPRILPMAQPARNTGAEPIFEKIAIIGMGLIGGSIALAARQIWPRGLVIGVDDKMVLEQAMVSHAIDVGADDLFVAAEADLVVLAAPVRQNIALLAQLPDAIQGVAVVTDVGSTKRAIMDEARRLPERLTFIGGHPLGGAARQGFGFARPDLFTGRPWLLTPGAGVPPDVLDRLQKFVTGLGGRPRVFDAVEHDRLLARISHLPQLAATALMAVIGEAADDEGLGMSGRGLTDTTRLASSPASVWTDICATNAEEIGSALDALIGTLLTLRGQLENRREVERLFERANTWRRALETAQAPAPPPPAQS